MFLFKNEFVSQTNLIKNSSFEQYTNLQCTGGFTTITDWSTIQSPDYFSVYCPNNFRGVPINTFGNSYAKNGNSYVGIEVYYDHPTIEIKEYIYQHLSAPLKADTTYCLSFFLKFASNTTISIKNVGSLFTVNAPSTGGAWYMAATPQVQNTASFYTDTTNWVELQGCFIAQGGEEYLTIGNFNSNINTDTATAYSNNPLTGTGSHISYYYIDSVSLWNNNFPTSIKEFNNENGFNIYPNPTNNTCMIYSRDIIQKIELTNIAGQLLLSETITQREHQLQLHNFSQGIYFIKVSYSNGLSITKKVIVNP